CTAGGDVDLFAIALPPGKGGYLVRFSVVGQNVMAPMIHIFDANRRSIARLSAGERQELRGWVAVAGGTRFYARVFQTYGANEAYTFTLATTPIADATEPN